MFLLAIIISVMSGFFSLLMSLIIDIALLFAFHLKLLQHEFADLHDEVKNLGLL